MVGKDPTERKVKKNLRPCFKKQTNFVSCFANSRNIKDAFEIYRFIIKAWFL